MTMKKTAAKKAVKAQQVAIGDSAVTAADTKKITADKMAELKIASRPIILEVVPPMSLKKGGVMAGLHSILDDGVETVAKSPLLPTRPIHEALVLAGFRMSAVAQASGAHAYSHQDGRTALYVEPDKWALVVNGERHEGTDKALKDLETAFKVRHLPNAPPPNIVHAVEMLGGMTKRLYVLDLLNGEKHYKDRVLLLKKVFQVDKVLVKESTLPHLVTAFHTALGITNGRSATAKAADFAVRCAQITAAMRGRVKIDQAALEAARKQYLLVTEKERVVRDGKPALPAYEKRTKGERAAEKEELIVQLEVLKESPEQPSVPRPDAEVVIVGADVCLLEDPANGIVMMQIEKSNSQGAICVYNNGKRVAVGVVSSETLNFLRPVNGADLVKAANQLLNPISPSVPVTPTAARHLTAVLHCKELTPMANTKKFAPPANAAKKATKPAEAKMPKAAKAKKESTGRTALYRLLNDTKSKWNAFKGQKATVIEALVKAEAVGKNAKGITSSALYAKLEGKLETNSTVERIAGFYLSTWQRDGIIEKYEPTA